MGKDRTMDDKQQKAIDALSRLVGFDVDDDSARPDDGSLKRRLAARARDEAERRRPDRA
jgi:hypothetical protein